MYGPSRGQWNAFIVLAVLGATFGLWKVLEFLQWVFTHIQFVR